MKESVKRLEDFINRNNKIIITSHITPDGDAIGSEIAFYGFLKNRNKEVFILNANETPYHLKFLDPDNKIKHITCESDITSNNINPEEYSAIILDCKEPHRTGKVIENYVLNEVKEYFVIDHHITDEHHDNTIIRTDLVATCEILYHIFKHYLNEELTLEMAIGLYTGIYTDSGSFVYERTTSHTFSAISDLVKIGVDPTFIFSNVHQKDRISRIKLIGRLLDNIIYEADGKIAILKATNDIIREAGATDEDAEGNDIVILPLKAEQTVISVFCREKIEENGEKIIKISIRSKDNYNVREIAKKFGGGGHKNACGLRSRLDIDDIINKLVKELKIIL